MSERAGVKRGKTENGNMKCGQWSQYLCATEEISSRRDGGTKPHIQRQLRRTKAEWQPIPVWQKVSYNPVIHANLYYNDVVMSQ